MYPYAYLWYYYLPLYTIGRVYCTCQDKHQLSVRLGKSTFGENFVAAAAAATAATTTLSCFYATTKTIRRSRRRRRRKALDISGTTNKTVPKFARVCSLCTYVQYAMHVSRKTSTGSGSTSWKIIFR